MKARYMLPALTGALSLACAAAPAGATVVLSQAANPFLGVGGFFDLTPYLSDAAGRTFSVTSATLSAFGYSAPDYAVPVTTTTSTLLGTSIVSVSPLVLQLDVLKVRTITYTDNVADTATLALGLPGQAAQSVSGAVTETIDQTEVVQAGVTDGPPDIFGFPGSSPIPTVQHTTLEDHIVRTAIYGPLELGFDLNAASLQQANAQQLVFYTLGSGAGGFPGIPGFPTGGGPLPTGPSQFTFDRVTLAFDLAQTGGPPPEIAAPGVPEPKTWALLIAGFGLAGAALRRPRRRQA